MAMTKKERAEFEAAILRAETLAALRWTAPVDRDLQPPTGSGYISGWDFNSYTSSIYPAWSESFKNGKGAAPTSDAFASTRGAKSLFSTREKALAALRHEVEKEAAAKLLRIEKGNVEERK